MMRRLAPPCLSATAYAQRVSPLRVSLVLFSFSTNNSSVATNSSNTGSSDDNNSGATAASPHISASAAVGATGAADVPPSANGFGPQSHSVRQLVRALHHHPAEQREAALTCTRRASDLSVEGAALAQSLLRRQSTVGKASVSTEAQRPAGFLLQEDDTGAAPATPTTEGATTATTTTSATSIENTASSEADAMACTPDGVCTTYYTEAASEAQVTQQFVTDRLFSGVSVAVIDTLDVAPFHTGNGFETASPLFPEHRADATRMPLLAWLQEQGATIVGKLQCRSPLSLNEGCFFGEDKPNAVAVAAGSAHYVVTTSLRSPAALGACASHDLLGFKPTSQTIGTFSRGKQFKQSLTIPSTSIGIVTARLDDLSFLWQAYTSAVNAEMLFHDHSHGQTQSQQQQQQKQKEEKKKKKSKKVEASTKEADTISIDRTHEEIALQAKQKDDTRDDQVYEEPSEEAVLNYMAEASEGSTGVTTTGAASLEEKQQMREDAKANSSGSGAAAAAAAGAKTATSTTATPTAGEQQDGDKTDATKTDIAAAAAWQAKLRQGLAVLTAQAARLRSPRQLFRSAAEQEAAAKKKKKDQIADIDVGWRDYNAAAMGGDTFHLISTVRSSGHAGNTNEQRQQQQAAVQRSLSARLQRLPRRLHKRLKRANRRLFRHSMQLYNRLRGQQLQADDRRTKILESIDELLADEDDEEEDVLLMVGSNQKLLAPRVELTVGYPAEWIDRFTSERYGSANDFHRYLTDSVYHRSSLSRKKKLEIVPLVFDFDLHTVQEASEVITQYELARSFERLFAQHDASHTPDGAEVRLADRLRAAEGMLAELPQEIVALLHAGQKRTIHDYHNAWRVRDDVIRSMEEQFQDIDMLVVPLLASPYVSGDVRTMRCLLPFHMGGHPMLSVQLEHNAYPVVLVGELGRDAALIENAATFLQFVRGVSSSWWRLRG